MQKESFTVDEVKAKLVKYCVYQERCHWEVEQKLNEFRLIQEAKDQIIIYLIQNNFLNEERFVKIFARSKFNQKNWGINKINTELKKRHIPSKLIAAGVAEINQRQYIETLNDLFVQKMKSLKSEKNIFIKKSKVTRFLLQKGYEIELISDLFRSG